MSFDTASVQVRQVTKDRGGARRQRNHIELHDLVSFNRNPIMITSRPKPARNTIDVSTKDLARRWRKRLGKPTEKIEAALAKVGNNAESVIKELESK